MITILGPYCYLRDVLGDACVCVCGTSRTADESSDAVPSCSWRCMGSTTTTCTSHAHCTPISDPYDQDLLFKLHDRNIEEVSLEQVTT